MKECNLLVIFLDYYFKNFYKKGAVVRAFIFSVILLFTLHAFDDNEMLELQAVQHCGSCHSSVRYSFEDFKSIKEHFNAPPMNLVIERLNEVIDVKLGDEDVKKAVVTAFMTSYIKEPDMDKGLCHVSCFVQYGTMPSLKGTMRDDEMEELVGYLYDKYSN